MDFKPPHSLIPSAPHLDKLTRNSGCPCLWCGWETQTTGGPACTRDLSAWPYLPTVVKTQASVLSALPSRLAPLLDRPVLLSPETSLVEAVISHSLLVGVATSASTCEPNFGWGAIDYNTCSADSVV